MLVFFATSTAEYEYLPKAFNQLGLVIEATLKPSSAQYPSERAGQFTETPPSRVRSVALR